MPFPDYTCSPTVDYQPYTLASPPLKHGVCVGSVPNTSVELALLPQNYLAILVRVRVSDSLGPILDLYSEVTF